MKITLAENIVGHAGFYDSEDSKFYITVEGNTSGEKGKADGEGVFKLKRIKRYLYIKSYRFIKKTINMENSNQIKKFNEYESTTNETLSNFSCGSDYWKEIEKDMYLLSKRDDEIGTLAKAIQRIISCAGTGN